MIADKTLHYVFQRIPHALVPLVLYLPHRGNPSFRLSFAYRLIRRYIHRIMILVEELHLTSRCHGRRRRIVDENAQQSTHVIKLPEIILGRQYIINGSRRVLQDTVYQISISVFLIIYLTHSERPFISGPADFVVLRNTNRRISFSDKVLLSTRTSRFKSFIAFRDQSLAVQDVFQTVLQDGTVTDGTIRAQRKTIVHNHRPVGCTGRYGSHRILRRQLEFQVTPIVFRGV